MINLEWFRTFKAIYETGTLSSAAQELFISQPGASLHLNSLEAYTGYKLFDRAARKMIPTERGTLLYNSIVDPLVRLEDAEHQFHRTSKAKRPTLGVGMCFETFQYTLEQYIAHLPFNLILRFGDYTQMLHDLDSGALDLIVTPQKGLQQNLKFKSFSKERIILVAGGGSDISQIQQLIDKEKMEEVETWLNHQLWYSTAADMEHLKFFWIKNFGHRPAFKPNFIVPNFVSIIRCLCCAEGFAIVPDFLCRKEIQTGKLKLVWEGHPYLENTLYFGTRKKTVYASEIKQLEEILIQKWV